MNHTCRITDEIESYADYKTRTIEKDMAVLNALLINISSSSLKVKHKKELLVKMLNEINTDLFTKF